MKYLNNYDWELLEKGYKDQLDPNDKDLQKGICFGLVIQWMIARTFVDTRGARVDYVQSNWAEAAEIQKVYLKAKRELGIQAHLNISIQKFAASAKTKQHFRGISTAGLDMPQGLRQTSASLAETVKRISGSGLRTVNGRKTSCWELGLNYARGGHAIAIFPGKKTIEFFDPMIGETQFAIEGAGTFFEALWEAQPQLVKDKIDLWSLTRIDV